MLTIKHDGSIYAKNLQSEGSRLYSGKWSVEYIKQQERLGFIKTNKPAPKRNFSEIIESVRIGDILIELKSNTKYYTITLSQFTNGIKDRLYYNTYYKLSRSKTEQEAYESAVKKFGELLSEYGVQE